MGTIMTWRLAASLIKLRDQVNQRWPARSKVSDGTIGDASHSSRTSDHNPNSANVVCALDLTNDPGKGLDARKFADMLKANKDPRIKYIISDRRIWTPSISDNWRVYNGVNAHQRHVHCSVKSDPSSYDNGSPWQLDWLGVESPTPPIAKPIGTVKDIQRLLIGWGHNLKIDGVFGPVTLEAVKKFQALKKLVQDGKVGPYTWIALNDMKPAQSPSGGPTGHVPAMFQPGTFKASEYAYEWARTFERFSANVYDDVGSPAQGYGHNAGSGIPPIPKHGDPPWTKEKAEEVLKVDMEDKARILNVRVKVPLTQRQIDALCLDQFQHGPIHGELLEAVNSGQPFGLIISNRPSSLAGLKRRYKVLGAMADESKSEKPSPKSW